MKQYLDREQMKVLENKGIDISDASHMWVRRPNSNEDRIRMNEKCICNCPDFDACPCYSLSDIIERLPDAKFVEDKKHHRIAKDRCYYLTMDKHRVLYDSGEDRDGNGGVLIEVGSYTGFRDTELIDSCFEALCKLMDGGYVIEHEHIPEKIEINNVNDMREKRIISYPRDRDKEYRIDWENLKVGDYVFDDSDSSFAPDGHFGTDEGLLVTEITEDLIKTLSGRGTKDKWNKESKSSLSAYAYYLAAFQSN